MNILAKGNSMFSTMKEGELYNIDIENNKVLNIGDIIVYVKNEMVICHRIIDIIRTKNNSIFYVTKGDNCTEPDPYAITLDKVIGKIII